MKNTLIDKRIKDLEKELAAVHGSIKTLAKHPPKARAAEAVKPSNGAPPVVLSELPSPPRPMVQAHSQGSGAPVSRPAAATPAARPELASFDANSRGRDERFVDYLASSLGPAQPLRRERNAERNRALVAIGCALILIFWIVSKILFL